MAEASVSGPAAINQDGSFEPHQPRGADRHYTSEKGSRLEPPDSPSPKPARRRFTAEYKLRVLREADRCVKPGELKALLRRERLYSSHLCAWRRQRQAGTLAALAPKKRGRKPGAGDSLARENRWLSRENQHLQARLRQAEAIIQMQARVSAILGIPLGGPEAPAAPPSSTPTTGFPLPPQPKGEGRAERTQASRQR